MNCPKCDERQFNYYGEGLKECQSCGFVIDDVFDNLVDDESDFNPAWFDESDFNAIWEVSG